MSISRFHPARCVSRRGRKVCAALFAASCLVAGAAHAGQVAGTVVGWQLYADGSFSFALTGVPALCGNGNLTNQRGAVVSGVRGMTGDGVKAMYTTVMTAFTDSKHVTVYTDETIRTTGWGCTVFALDVNP